MKNKAEGACAESFCTLKIPLARENYYFGKMLTVRGLQSEQHYLNEKRWLINRYGIGWGVLCGLNVAPDPNNPCGVIVEPGLALDRYGNEILVCEPQAIDLATVWAKEHNESQDEKETTSKQIYLALRYKECLSNPSPIPVEECGDLETECAYNRTIETFKIDVSCIQPEKPKSLREEFDALLKCETDCKHFLENPAPVILGKCPPQEKYRAITLACICYRKNVPVHEYHIDNISFRKLAFSNDMLYELIRCLRSELWQAKGARYDRRRHVPLLANTIAGLNYQSGKLATLDQDAGVHPYRITTDGDVIWITDQASPQLIRIDRKQNKIIPGVDLSSCDKTNDSSWGIAFDGRRHLWITHNNENQGKLTRLDTCDLTDCWTFSALPDCDAEDLGDCQKYCSDRNGVEKTQAILPYSQEVVYHQGLLYVSHGWELKSNNDQTTDDKGKGKVVQDNSSIPRITIIDTERCCILKTCLIESTQYCIPVSPIIAMVSDGDLLWFTYKATYYDKRDPVVVVRYLKYDPNAGADEADCELGLPCGINGKEPEKIAFDGSYLWVTHDDGASKINVSSGEVVRSIDTEQKQTAMAYGGGDNIWTVELNAGNDSGEARINRIDIHSANRSGEIEFIHYSGKKDAEYKITDAQFDGSFIYISAYYTDAETAKKGVIHRVLP